eukprot:TRINITY_DN56459_c0_g1_i1.p1 TRINITY_DN56459_c0_g1~~TRINITY_DN56459_c0_g1_i1.p1  ORF type:complete len:497 (+),score=40.74 TRINITY_DN56459_c0_g1_i1:107-1492(+)
MSELKKAPQAAPTARRKVEITPLWSNESATLRMTAKSPNQTIHPPWYWLDDRKTLRQQKQQLAQPTPSQAVIVSKTATVSPPESPFPQKPKPPQKKTQISSSLYQRLSHGSTYRRASSNKKGKKNSTSKAPKMTYGYFLPARYNRGKKKRRREPPKAPEPSSLPRLPVLSCFVPTVRNHGLTPPDTPPPTDPPPARRWTGASAATRPADEVSTPIATGTPSGSNLVFGADVFTPLESAGRPASTYEINVKTPPAEFKVPEPPPGAPTNTAPRGSSIESNLNKTTANQNNATMGTSGKPKIHMPSPPSPLPHLDKNEICAPKVILRVRRRLPPSEIAGAGGLTWGYGSKGCYSKNWRLLPELESDDAAQVENEPPGYLDMPEDEKTAPEKVLADLTTVVETAGNNSPRMIPLSEEQKPHVEEAIEICKRFQNRGMKEKVDARAVLKAFISPEDEGTQFYELW